MKTQKSIYIGGIKFNIENQAFKIYKSYINNLKNYFSNQAEGKEIMRDIEFRIGEILDSFLPDKNKIITSSDINMVIDMIGTQELMRTDIEEHQSEQKTYKNKKLKSKPNIEFNFTHKDNRLYRDPSNRVLGAVCSGLGNYFKLNINLIRAAFLIAFIFFGSGILLYLVLWIVIPLAKTPVQKLEMNHSKITLNDLRNFAKSEGHKIKRNYSS